MKLSFAKGAWEPEKELAHAYSYRFDDRPVFTQFEDSIGNLPDPAGPGGFEYISVLSRKQYGPGTKITARCSFEDDGAPLIVLADKLYRDPDGALRYGTYLEVVLYKNGVNVWRMRTRDGKVTWKKLLGAEFVVPAGEIHTLSVLVGEQSLKIDADGRVMTLLVEDMYPSFHAGVDACEGYNRFYDLEIDGTALETE